MPAAQAVLHRLNRLAAARPQVITCADFHPHHCSIFGYSTSKGCIRLADMRAAALCDQHAKMFEDSEPAVRVVAGTGTGVAGLGCRAQGRERQRAVEVGVAAVAGGALGCWWGGGMGGSSAVGLQKARHLCARKCMLAPLATPSTPSAARPACAVHAAPAAVQGPRSFFSEIISSINDIKFSRDGRYVLSRDYMTLKLWDLHMENAPVGVYPVHEVLRGKVSKGVGEGRGDAGHFGLGWQCMTVHVLRASCTANCGTLARYRASAGRRFALPNVLVRQCGQ